MSETTTPAAVAPPATTGYRLLPMETSPHGDQHVVWTVNPDGTLGEWVCIARRATAERIVAALVAHREFGCPYEFGGIGGPCALPAGHSGLHLTARAIAAGLRDAAP